MLPHAEQQQPQLASLSQSQEAPLTDRTDELVEYSTHISASSPVDDLFSSQNSDMDKALCEIMLGQGSGEESSPLTSNVPAATPQIYSGDPIILAHFSTMLDQGLYKARKHITSYLKHEFQESKLDETIARTNQNTNCIEDLQQ